MQINAINNFNKTKFGQNSRIEEYKKLQESRNFKATHFSELTPDEQDEVIIRIVEINHNNENQLGIALENFLRNSCNK